MHGFRDGGLFAVETCGIAVEILVGRPKELLRELVGRIEGHVKCLEGVIFEVAGIRKSLDIKHLE